MESPVESVFAYNSGNERLTSWMNCSRSDKAWSEIEKTSLVSAVGLGSAEASMTERGGLEVQEEEQAIAESNMRP